MRKPFAADIAAHRLRREIVATQLANAMINGGGPTYVTRVSDQTGADTSVAAQAFVAVREIFAVDALNDALDALDGKVAGATQLRLYRAAQELPSYAQPRFVRLMPALQTTSTHKHQKAQLRREGVDPRVVSDPLFIRTATTYEPLTAALYDGVLSGAVRL